MNQEEIILKKIEIIQEKLKACKDNRLAIDLQKEYIELLLQLAEIKKLTNL